MNEKIENPKNLDEYIEPKIKDIIEGIQIKDIAEFVNDMKISFKTYVDN